MHDLGIARLHPDDLRSWLGVQGVSATLLLAASGGVDSSVLWHLLHATGLPYEVAHVNYGLRGAESDDDAAHVLAKAERLGVRAHVHTARRPSGSSNTQDWARRVRYSFFDALVTERGLAGVLVAQHADDQLETWLIGLTQGRGLRRLAGMQSRRDHVLRPLLHTPRQSVAAYAKTHDLEHREDASNASDAYLRNRLRRHVVPSLREESTDVSGHASRLSGQLQNLLSYSFDAYNRELPAYCLDDACQLLATPKVRASEGLSGMLAYRLDQLGFAASTLTEVEETLRDSAVLVGRRTYETRSRDRLLVLKHRSMFVLNNEAIGPFALSVPLNAEADRAYTSTHGTLTLTWSDVPPAGADIIGAAPRDRLQWRTLLAADALAIGDGHKPARRLLSEASLPATPLGLSSVLVRNDAVIGLPGIRPLPALHVADRYLSFGVRRDPLLPLRYSWLLDA